MQSEGMILRHTLAEVRFADIKSRGKAYCRCCYRLVTVHSHVNHSADWHGGCTYCLECISPIAKGDSKWRDTLLFTAML